MSIRQNVSGKTYYKKNHQCHRHQKTALTLAVAKQFCTIVHRTRMIKGAQAALDKGMPHAKGAGTSSCSPEICRDRSNE